MRMFWFPQHMPAQRVVEALQHMPPHRTMDQQVQDWIHSRFPSHLHLRVYLTDSLQLVDVTCPICLEEHYQAFTILKCNHVFHSTCLSKWTQKHKTCPMCRHVIV